MTAAEGATLLVSTQIIGRPLIRFERVTSTMDIAESLADLGAPEGTVVLADIQTEGRGRAGRAWVAEPRSSLMLSIILRPDAPPESRGLVSLLAGLAVARTAEILTARPTMVKWPNDVLVDGRKVSGILLHSRSTKHLSARYLIVGIGINVRSVPDVHSASATSLGDANAGPVDDRAVLDRLLAELDDVYAAFVSGHTTPLLRELNTRLASRDEAVVVIDGTRRVSGIVAGIGQSGDLLLEQDDGSTRSVVSGELTRGPVPVAR